MGYSCQWDTPGDSYKVYINTPDFRTIVCCNWARPNSGETDREITIEIKRYVYNALRIRISFHLEDDFDPEYKIFPYNANILLINHWVILFAERLTELLEYVDNHESRIEITLGTEKSKKKRRHQITLGDDISHTIGIVSEAVYLIEPGEIGLTSAVLSAMANRIVYPDGKTLIQDAKNTGLGDITAENYEESVKAALSSKRWQEPLYALKPFHSLMRACGSLIIHPSTPVPGYMSRFDRKNVNLDIMLSRSSSTGVRPMSLRQLELIQRIISHDSGMILLGNSLLSPGTSKTMTSILSEETLDMSTDLLSESAVEVCQEALMTATPDEALSIPGVLAMRVVIRSLASSMDSADEWKHLRSVFLDNTDRIMHPVQDVASVCPQMGIVRLYVNDILALAGLLDNHLGISSDSMSILALTRKQFLAGNAFRRVNKTMQLYHTGVIKAELSPYSSLRDSMGPLARDVFEPLIVSLLTIAGVEPNPNTSISSTKEFCSIMISLVETLSVLERNTQRPQLIQEAEQGIVVENTQKTDLKTEKRADNRGITEQVPVRRTSTTDAGLEDY